MLPSLGRDMDFTRLRDARTVTNEFEKRARLQFPKLRFHDLRGSHETALLDSSRPAAGMIRLSWLRAHAKRTQKADTGAANIIANMSKAALGTD